MNLDALALPLPEDILKKKWAGDISGALAAIDYRLSQDMPRMLRDRLRLEREILKRLPTQYPYDKAQALLKMRELIPDFTVEELDSYDLAGRIDFIYLNGEKRYFVRFHRTLIKTIPELMARTGQAPTPRSQWLDPMIEKMKTQGSLSARIHIKADLMLAQESFIPGETYRAHLPIPQPGAAQSQVELVQLDPACQGVAPETSPARTVYFERTMKENKPFKLEYRYLSRMVYADLTQPAPQEPLYPDAPPPTQQDLASELPCMQFTPYLRDLAREIRGDEKDHLKIARKFYDFITTQVKYSFVRDYFQIDHLGEYAAVNLKGDCGIQALLFILLCRISGIPARWQSGLAVEPTYVGSHDWAQFYVEGWGWLFCDCSYGGSAWRNGNLERWDFYFGNLEPMRMAANSQYAAPFDFPKEHLRIDPYDNQSGEMECLEKGFTGRDVDADYELVSVEYGL